MKKLIVLVVIATILFLIGLIFYFTQDKYREFDRESIPHIRVSNLVKQDISAVMKRKHNIIAVHIRTVHFQRNIRADTYSDSNSQEFKDIFIKYFNNKPIEVPLFDSTPENNRRIIRLINGEFICNRITEDPVRKYFPPVAHLSTVVCSIGIPPQAYGEFTGILTIYLKDTPSPEEQEMLFLFSRDLSIKIYENNTLQSIYRD